MIFKRRDPRTLLARARDVLSPRKGWRRGFAYIGRRVQRLPDTPHRIALGFACGALASFTPLFTLHIVVAMAMAWAVRGNLLAAALGTAVGNPLTFPFIAGAALALGGRMLGAEEAARGFDMARVFRDLDGFLDTLFLPYLIGGILPGLVCAAICYALLRPAIAAYQRRRRGRLMEAARRRVRAHLEARAIKRNPAADPAE